MQRLACLTACMIMFLGTAASGAMLTVEADTLQRRGSLIEASGCVVVSGGDLTLKADYIVYDTDSEDIWAAGRCSLQDGRGEVTASALSYNIRRSDLHIRDGSFLSHDNATKISGESITRYGHDFISATSVVFTPCLGVPPDWSLKVEELEIPVGGYGRAKDARFMVRQWPLLRVPWLMFPARLERHSGLLLPELGGGSDYGYRIGLPLYVVVDGSVDATVTPTWLVDRGLLARGELRYCLDHDRVGMLYLESLRDRRGGERDTGGVRDVVPDGRWFFKARQTGEGLNWDVNLVSTEDYFRDIGAFIDENPLQEDRPAQRLNLLDDSRLEDLVSRAQWVDSRWGLSFALSGRFTQDLTTRDDDRTIQQQPTLSVRMRQRAIPFTPLVASAEAGTTRIVTTGWIEAFKDRARIEVSMPLALYPYLTVKPYIVEHYRDTRFSETWDAYEDSFYAERWGERGVSLSTALYSPRFSNGMEHQVVPEVTWAYRSRYGGNPDPDDVQDIFPLILEGDDWGKDWGTKVSLGNYIRDGSGLSRADLTVGSTYSHLHDEWQGMLVEANLRPATWLAASHMNTLDRGNKGSYATMEHTSRVVVTSPRGDRLSLGYEYNREDTKLLLAGMGIELVRGFSAGFDGRYDQHRHAFVSQVQALRYTSQCWSVELRRKAEASDEDTPSDTTWSVTVRLLGMGDIFQPGPRREEHQDGPLP